MRTLVYKIKVSKEDKEILKSLQEDYSIDFRKLYNNLDLSEDINYMNSLNFKSKKLKEYLIKEVKSFKNVMNRVKRDF